MISIKKYLDQRNGTKPGKAVEPIDAVVDAYRSALLSVAKATALDGSSHGVELGNRLIALDRRIAAKPGVETVHDAVAEFEASVALWGDRSAAERNAMDDELKQLILAVAETVQSVLTRDKEHSARFGAISEGLEGIGTLTDITKIRNAIVRSVAELRSSVESMNSANRNLVTELQTKVTTFETRLKSVEHLALTDALTGLANRRCLEDRITYNIENQVQFAIVLLDLNRFKLINDTFGHTAGDDILRQFAEKLKLKSRGTDLIGRWGGDEFLLVLPNIDDKLRALVSRLQAQVCGRYLLHGSDGFYSTLDVDASAGAAQWMAGESMTQLVARADQDMYRDKGRMKGLRSAEEALVAQDMNKEMAQQP